MTPCTQDSHMLWIIDNSLNLSLILIPNSCEKSIPIWLWSREGVGYQFPTPEHIKQTAEKNWRQDMYTYFLRSALKPTE